MTPKYGWVNYDALEAKPTEGAHGKSWVGHAPLKIVNILN